MDDRFARVDMISRVLPWFKRKARPPRPTKIRDTLYGDMLLGQWAQGDSLEPPWSIFAAAHRSIQAGQRTEATSFLREVLSTPGLEARHYLQAWHELRKLGVSPTTEAKQLFGVVVEVSLDEGLDILAAYSDLSARYFNYSGAAVIWDRPDDSMDPHVQGLLASAKPILEQIGVWEGERPPAPPRGQARISMLAPAGLFFGQAPLSVLGRDPLAAPAVAAALQLMQALIEKSETARTTG